MRVAGLFAAMFLAVLMALPATAHESRPGFVQIQEREPRAYSVLWRQPSSGIADTITLALEFPQDCSQKTIGQPVETQGVRTHRSLLECGEPLAGRGFVLAGLEQTRMNVLVRYEGREGSVQTLRLSPGEREAVISEKPTVAGILSSYGLLGIEHILEGIDHLLFVLTLFFLSSGWKRLLLMITAFTVAHSITLALATLGAVSLPGAPVEALIALSIVLAAAECLRPSKRRASLMRAAPWVVAFAFGLLHGFGFAGALEEIGLPEGDVPLALLAFNLGVEAGQILFVAAVAAVYRFVGLIAGPGLQLAARAVLLYTAGGAAAYWMIERGAPIFL